MELTARLVTTQAALFVSTKGGRLRELLAGLVYALERSASRLAGAIFYVLVSVRVLLVSLRSIPLSVFWLFFSWLIPPSEFHGARVKLKFLISFLAPQNGWQHMPNQYSRQCENNSCENKFIFSEELLP